MYPGTFEHALSSAFIDALRKQAEGPVWWHDILDDPKLIIAVRGRSLNVYWQGQAIFNITYPNGSLRVTTHEKFLTDPELAAQVTLLEDETFDTTILKKRGHIPSYKSGSLSEGTLSKLKKTAALFAGDENVAATRLPFATKT